MKNLYARQMFTLILSLTSALASAGGFHEGTDKAVLNGDKPELVDAYHPHANHVEPSQVPGATAIDPFATNPDLKAAITEMTD